MVNVTQNQTGQLPVSNTTMNDSKNAIDAAIAAIASANSHSKDTSTAMAKLSDAERAFEAGNYQLALELANSAKSLASTAPPQSATQQANGTATGAGKPTEHSARVLLFSIGVFGAIAVLAILFYLYLRNRKYNRKSKL